MFKMPPQLRNILYCKGYTVYSNTDYKYQRCTCSLT